MSSPLFPNAQINIAGPEGNAYAVMGTISNIFKQCGGSVCLDTDDGSKTVTWAETQTEMMSGDYENLLDVAERFVTIRGRA